MEFKRMNFFDGFFTHAKDWQTGEAYHIEKRKLHNRCLHTPGVVEHELENLEVRANGTSVDVRPGYAIDGQGRDLYLSQIKTLQINVKEYDLPTIVYVLIRYDEKKEDFRENRANKEYEGYAFVREHPVVEISTDAPDNVEAIELARIALSPQCDKVKDPADSAKPGPDEVDRTHVRKATAIRGRVRLEDIGRVISEGAITVSPSTESQPSEDDPKVCIEDNIRDPEPHWFYLVSAYPERQKTTRKASEGKARITWRIESVLDGDVVEYWLFFKNLGKMEAKIWYKVYKID